MIQDVLIFWGISHAHDGEAACSIGGILVYHIHPVADVPGLTAVRQLKNAII